MACEAWDYPYDNLPETSSLRVPKQDSLRFKETPEQDVRETDIAARDECVNLLLRTSIPPNHVPENLVDIDIKRLADAIEPILRRSSKHYAAAVLGYLPYNVVRGLVRLVFGVADVEVFLRRIAAEANGENVASEEVDGVVGGSSRKYVHLRAHLSNSDTIHQSLLRSTRSLVRDFPSPHARTAEIQPAFPVYTETGRADPLFRRRHLTPHEALHPVAYPPTDDTSYARQTDVPIGHCSVAGTLEQFRRAFDVFTCGILNNVDLHRQRAIVTGGAVTACLMPWPAHIRALYMEERKARWTIERALGFPVEIGMEIARYVDIIKTTKKATDTALLRWLSGANSAYATSDVDIFFIVPPGSTDVGDAPDRFVATCNQIIANRASMDVSSMLDVNTLPAHWAFATAQMDDVDEEDWFINAHLCADGGKDLPYGFEEDVEYPEGFWDVGKDGWSDARRTGTQGRLRFSPVLRTNNSVTVTGLHPVRHTQLMLPIVRAAEEVVLAFDLDCVAVYYDGTNVYATQRALRSFNTRTNMVDMISVRDRARAARMQKYTSRGFATMFFEVCRHWPRCDVDASQEVRDVIVRAFQPKPEKERRDPYDRDYDEDEDDSDEERESNEQYEALSLPFGPCSDIEDLKVVLSRLVSPYDPWRDEMKTPIVLRLTFPETQNVRHFKSMIVNPHPEHSNFIPMQFKWIKDAWLRRRIRFGVAFDRCYMCGADPDAARAREEEDADSVTGDGVVLGLEAEHIAQAAKEEKERRKKEKKELQEQGVDEMDVEDSDDKEDMSVEEEDKDDNASSGTKNRKIPLCPSCDRLNSAKRSQTHDMKGMTALVTGGRTKIGFRTALKLLRCGATVLVTSRFPLVAAERFHTEPDSSEWWDRLRVYALDMRDVGSVVAFTDHLRSSYGELDIVINNAAQTIRRPAKWHEPILMMEAALARAASPELMQVWVRGDTPDTFPSVEDGAAAGASALSVLSRRGIGSSSNGGEIIRVDDSAPIDNSLAEARALLNLPTTAPLAKSALRTQLTFPSIDDPTE
ncbi:hypothetical protein HK104_003003, partial [Borealophlyctis nickersoniae]